MLQTHFKLHLLHNINALLTSVVLSSIAFRSLSIINSQIIQASLLSTGFLAISFPFTVLSGISLDTAIII